MLGRARCALVALALASCAFSCTPRNVAPAPPLCSTTPISELVLVDGSKWGQRDGDVFFQTANPPDKPPLRLRAAPELMKILVILSNPLPSPAPDKLEVQGREQRTGKVTTFLLNQTLTTDVPFGAQWGTNFEFPAAGCWDLSVDVPANRGRVTVAVYSLRVTGRVPLGFHGIAFREARVPIRAGIRVVLSNSPAF